MVKKRRTRYHHKKLEANVLGSDDEQLYAGINPNEEEILRDEVDEFHLQQEKILLEDNSFRGKKTLDESADEEEVLPLDISDSDQSEDEELEEPLDMASDIEEDKEEDALPDPKAWGKKKSMYYSTDYVDQDFGGFEGSDAEAAEMEEREALALQQKMMQQLDEADFDLGLFTETIKPTDDSEEVTEKIKKDFTMLSANEKLELLKRESPELLELIKDFKDKITELKERLFKLIELTHTGKIPPGIAADYIKIKSQIILNYCMNISYYMTLKSKRIIERTHPVMKRLTNYYNLMKKTSSIDNHLQPEIETIFQQLEEKGSYEPIVVVKRHQKKLKFQLPVKTHKEEKKESLIEKMELHSSEEEMFEEKEHSDKRGINYQIAKNKGLTPHRKKEQRNPRVKHRMKYRKAKIRRKGQVREPRKELVRYGGELSGIKANLSKSVKFV